MESAVAVWVAILLGMIRLAKAAEEPSPQTVVYLDRPTRYGPAANEMTTGGILSQELARQAFLIAAREEMGLTTRDARLGDPMPTEGNNLSFAFGAKKEDRFNPPLDVLRGVPGKRELVLRHKLQGRIAPFRYRQHAEEMEQLSRTVFVEALKKAGFSGQPLPQSDAAVPEAVENLLGEMTFTSQFSALRQLHKLMSTKGSSPALTGALVRGYSSLGYLTEDYWAPSYKIFKARALLYAQRMCAANESDPVAHWHRAYALGMIGLPNDALADMQEGNQLWAAMPDANRPARPEWVDLIAAHSRYDVGKLDASKAPKSQQQLTWLLRFCCYERARSVWQARDIATRAMSLMPDCDKFCYGQCRFGPSGSYELSRQAYRWMLLLGNRLYLALKRCRTCPCR